MADDALYQIVYPNSAPGLQVKVTVDATTLRGLVSKVSPISERLTLTSPPKEDLSQLSRQASPLRFERADIAVRLLTLHPELGDLQLWRDATEKDAGLGELVVLLEPTIEWTDRALAATLAEMSVMTGRIERTVDRMDKEGPPGYTPGFHVADLERARIDEAVATARARISDVAAHGAEQNQQASVADQRDVAKRQLMDADPGRMLQGQGQGALKIKKKGT